MLGLSQVGDTIVEVLVAIAIISTILAGGYTVTNTSLTAERRSQEHSIALGILQSQLEALRSASQLAPRGVAFCYIEYNNSLKPETTTATTGSPPAPYCNFGDSGNYGNSVEPVYKIQITGPVSKVFTASAMWDQLGGGQAQATLLYKLK